MIQTDLFTSPFLNTLPDSRTEGIERTRETNRAFTLQMRAYAIQYAKEHGTVSVDPLRIYADAHGITPITFRGWSGILTGSEFIFIDWVKSEYPSNHGRRIANYRLRSNGVEA